MLLVRLLIFIENIIVCNMIDVVVTMRLKNEACRRGGVEMSHESKKKLAVRRILFKFGSPRRSYATTYEKI